MCEKEEILKKNIVDAPLAANLNNGDKSTIKPIKILVAEDNEDWIYLIGNMVGKISSNVIYTNNGADAITICMKNPDIDLILMDINMPILNGYEATTEIRKFNRDVIIIAQTSSPEEVKSNNCGFNDCVSKASLICQLPILIDKYFNKSVV